MLYDTLEDATRRLDRSVVRVDNIPVFIKEFTPDGQILCLNLIEGNTFVFDYKRFSNKVDITPVKLGYCNCRGVANYLMRLPTRKWKQGLGADNITIVGRDFGRDILQDKALGRVILGKYPNYKKSLEFVKKTPGASMAFSRSFAIRDREMRPAFSLEYRGSPVGTIKDNRIEFKKQFIHLDSYLRELIRDVDIQIV